MKNFLKTSISAVEAFLLIHSTIAIVNTYDIHSLNAEINRSRMILYIQVPGYLGCPRRMLPRNASDLFIEKF